MKSIPFEKQQKAAIGALLFGAGDFLSAGRLSRVLGVKRSQVAGIIEDARADWQKVGLKVLEHEGKYQLVADNEYAGLIQQVRKQKETEGLGRAGREVLAVVAFRKGATKEEIELIRGVNSAWALRRLLIKGLIKEKEIEGVRRYQVTFRFLRAMGIEKLEDLPGFKELSQDKKVQAMLTGDEENEESVV